MRVGSFVAAGESVVRCGDVRGDRVVSFTGGVTPLDVLDAATHRPVADGPEFAVADVRFVMPYRPRVVFIVGMNYQSHVTAGTAATKKRGGDAWVDPRAPGELPTLLKGPGSAVGPHDDIVRPKHIANLDYEGELVAIVGADGEIGGYAVANDVSARDAGDKWQLTRSKAGDTFCPWGPWVTTADEIENPYDLRIRTWVAGELRQDGSTSEMLIRIPEIMAYISKTITPRRGDLVLTGTVAGTAAEMIEPKWLQLGQSVRVEIDGLGAIENTVVAS